MKNKKLLLLILPALLLLTACGTGQDNLATQIDGIFNWHTYNYLFSWVILFFAKSTGGNLVVGVIITTIVVRALMIPAYKKQIKSQEEMQVIQPELKKLQKKYEGKTSPDQRQKMGMEQRALYKEHNVSPLAGCLPTLLQMPVLFVFYGSIRNIFVYTEGGKSAAEIIMPSETFTNTVFGVDASEPMIVFTVLCAVATFLSIWVGTIGQDKTAPGAGMMKTMIYIMPVMMIFIGLSLPGAMTVYLTVSSLFGFLQTAYFKRKKIMDTYQKSRLAKK